MERGGGDTSANYVCRTVGLKLTASPERFCFIGIIVEVVPLNLLILLSSLFPWEIYTLSLKVCLLQQILSTKNLVYY